MTKHLFRIVLCIGLIAIVLACMTRFGVFKTSNMKMTISSLLTKTEDISELSAAEFKYRGIAEIYKDEKRTKVKCRVCYDAVVKAGIDLKDVKFDVDVENKKVIGTLPDIDLKVTIVDEESMALLPSDSNVDLVSMIQYSKEDAENEARASEELLKTARHNLQATIEGILYPVLQAEGYSISWN